jgi:hypothetical protein
MIYTSTSWTPNQTPLALKILLGLIGFSSIAIAFIDTALTSFNTSFSLAWWVALSHWGWSHYYLWQPFSYLFVYPAYGGLNFSYLIELALILYILWLMAAEICERVGARAFMVAYLSIGALSGLLTITLGPTYSLLQGPQGSLLTTFTLWSMLGPYQEILLFFLVPVIRFWLFIAVIASAFLVTLAQGQWLQLSWYFWSVIGAYLYGTIAWRWIGPVPWSVPMDNWLHHFSDRLHAFSSHLTEKSTSSSATIYDFRTGQPIMNDDAFIDAMLAKIARHGEEALSWSERQRMDKIALKRKNKQPPV